MKSGRNAVIAAGILAGVTMAAPAPVPAQQQEVRATLTGESGRLPRLAIAPFTIPGTQPVLGDSAKTIAEVLWKDLEFERAYRMVDPSVASGIAPGPVETEGYLDVLHKTNPDARKVYDGVASRVGMGRWGRVEEIAYPCVFLASEASSFINGTTLIIDGGPSPNTGDEAI